MTVEERIKEYPACEAIDLKGKEIEVYTGAGWKLAGFRNGKLKKLHDLDGYEFKPGEPFNHTVVRATIHNTDMLKSLEAEGLECWLVMASSYQLCKPTKINSGDTLSVAKISRRIGEELSG